MGCACSKSSAGGDENVKKAVSAWGHSGKGKQNIIFIGIDGSGKTSLAYALSHPTQRRPGSTGGEEVTSATLGGLEVTFLDMPGRPSERPSWGGHLAKADKVVFVVDSTDELRLPVARHELWNVAGLLREHGLPLLVLANKQDRSQYAVDDGVAALDVPTVSLMLDHVALEASLPKGCAVKGCSVFKPEQLRAEVLQLLDAS